MIRIGTARPGRQHERGIALSLVALSMVAILGIAALVVDIGNGYRTRRALIPATDAAALAAAQTYISGGDGCGGTAGTYLTANEAAATMTACNGPAPGAARGRVTVTATNNVSTWFAPVIGQGDYTVSSTSTVQWGPPLAVTGLRPIGLCLTSNLALENLVLSPPAPGSAPVQVTVPYTKNQATPCGLAEGNWGTVDLDGGSANNNDLSDAIINGYSGPVSFGDDFAGSCVNEPHCYATDTGALAGAQAALNILQASGIWFTVPVFDYATGQGSSPDTKYHLMGVLRVQLVSFDVTGSNGNGGGGGSNGGGGGGSNGNGKGGGSGGGGSNGNGNGNGNNAPYFTLNVQAGLITGTCCGTGSGAGNNRVMAICAVDPAATGSCTA